ncbi:MAG: DJ-1/PfpI family protein, partial [Pseudomonadota bacterium]
MASKRSIGILLFDGFETLDVMGPVELFGMHPQAFSIHFIAEETGPVSSAQGQQVIAEHKCSKDDQYDIVLVPGGKGTRSAIENESLLGWIQRVAENSEILCSVCTGTALLARAGVLDGKRATSNKKSFAWVKEQGP